MSWSANLSGHVENADDEKVALDALRVAAKASGASHAVASSHYHGNVNLLEPVNESDAEESQE